MKKNRKIISIAQNVLIIVLFVSMLLLSTACFLKLTASLVPSSAGNSFNIPGIDESDDINGGRFAGTALLPGVIAVSDESAHFATYDYKTVSTVYKLVSKDMISVLSAGTANLKRTDVNEWLGCDNYSKYAYFRFRRSLPLPVMLDYAGASADVCASYSDGIDVTEVYMVYSGTEATLYIRSADIIYSVTGNSGQGRFNDAVRTIENSNAVNFSMVQDKVQGNRKILLSDDLLTVSGFTVDAGVAGSSLDSSARASLLETFQMNPDKTAVNEYPSGGISFVGAGGTLIVDRNFTYSAHQSASVNISAIANEYKEMYKLGVYLRASEHFIVNILKSFGVGNSPSLCFESVSADSETLTLSYIYLADNMPVFIDGKSLGIRLSFTDNKLVYLASDIVSVAPTDGNCTLLSGTLISNAYPADIKLDALFPVCIADDRVSYSEWLTVFVKEPATEETE